MAMLRPVSEMKESGIEWVGNIPSYWKVAPIRSCFNEVVEKNKDGLVKNALKFTYGEIVPKTNFDADEDDYVADTILNYYVVFPGTIMINGLNLNFDFISQRTALVREKGIITSAYVGIIPKDYSATLPEFMNYLFKAYDYRMAFHNMGGGVRKILNFARLKSQMVCFPGIKEQQAIAAYLDDRCSKMDEIIAEATASIEEYKELKQAVIDQYSMFGINKDVDLRDTDYSWFPYMPAHWKLVRANRLFKEDVRPMQDGDVSLSLSQIDGLIPTDDMSERSLKSATHDNWKHVIPEDLVLNRFKGHLGVFFASKYEGMVSFHYGVYHAIRDGVLSKYYEYLFHSTTYKSIFALLSNGITVGLQNLSNGNFYSIKLLLPPIEEQVDIVRHLDERTSQIDALISEKQALIDDLQAYKKSLIYEVVTGKRRVV